MLTALLSFLIPAHAAEPTLRLTFRTAFGRPCAIALSPSTSVNADFDVTELSIPGLPRGTAEVRAALLGVPGALGDARLLTPEEAGNYVEHTYESLLEDTMTSADPVYAGARAAFTAEDLESVRAARRFTRGEITGRAVRISAVAPVHGEAAVQAQSLLLLMPDETYPRAIVAGVDGSRPTWTPLLNLRWPGDALLLHPARVSEPTRGPSYLVIRPPVRPTYVEDGSVTFERW